MNVKRWVDANKKRLVLRRKKNFAVLSCVPSKTSLLFLAGGGDGDGPDADLVVGVSGEEGLAVGGPGHGQALGLDGGLVAGPAGHLGLELLDHVFALQVPDLDDRAGGGAEPVPVCAGKKHTKS